MDKVISRKTWKEELTWAIRDQLSDLFDFVDYINNTDEDKVVNTIMNGIKIKYNTSY